MVKTMGGVGTFEVVLGVSISRRFSNPTSDGVRDLSERLSLAALDALLGRPTLSAGL